jgi:hypothetical protein
MIELNKKNDIQHEDMVKALEDHFHAYHNIMLISLGICLAPSLFTEEPRILHLIKVIALLRTSLIGMCLLFLTLFMRLWVLMFSNQLCKWCNHCNKEHFTAEDKQRRKDWLTSYTYI